MTHKLNALVVLIRGGGEVASAAAHKLARSHFKVCLTEIAQPLAVSRVVAFSEAIYDGEKEIEGVVAKRVTSVEEIASSWRENKIPILVDTEARIIDRLNPDVLIDAIMAKKNLGTKITDAPLVIGLGPGFQAGKDVHIVVETNNSENLGKVILDGEAENDTGVPLVMGGLSFERVVHSSEDGLFLASKQIGDTVLAGETVASVAGYAVKVKIDGVLRALLRSNIKVRKGTKLAEVDPSGCKEVCYSIRPKMRAIAGGVLEAIMIHFNT